MVAVADVFVDLFVDPLLGDGGGVLVDPVGPEFHPGGLDTSLAVYDSSRRSSVGEDVLNSMLDLDGSTDYLSYAGDPTGGGDFTWTKTLRPDSYAATATVFYAIDASGYYVHVFVATDGKVHLNTGGPNGADHETVGGIAVPVGEVARLSFAVTRAGDAPDTVTIRTSAGISRISNSGTRGAIGALAALRAGSLGASLYFTGSMSDAACFGSKLGLADELAFLDGVSPDKLSVAPRSFLPLQGDYVDRGTNPVTWTVNGTPAWNTTDPAVAVLRSRVAAPECGTLQGNGSAYASVAADLSNSNVFSMGCTYYLPANPSGTRALFGIGDTNSQSLQWVGVNTSGGLFNEAWVSGSAGGGSGASPTHGQVNTAALVVNGATSRTLYSNGVSAGTSSASFAPTGLDTTSFGDAFLNGAAGLRLGTGEWIARGWVIAGALDATQVAAIAAGADPRSVADLAGYSCTLLAPLGSNYVNGTTAHDLSGAGNALTLTGSPTHTRAGGATLAPAHAFGFAQGISHRKDNVFGGGMEGNGSAYASVAADLSNSNVFTQVCWARFGPASAQIRAAMGMGDTDVGDNIYQVYMWTDGKVYAEAYDTASGYAGGIVSSVVADTGWHHYAFVVDGSGSRKLYVDGVLVGSSAATRNVAGLDNATFGAVLTDTLDYELQEGDAVSRGAVIAGALDAAAVARIAGGADPRSVATVEGFDCTLFAPLGAEFVSGSTAEDRSGAGNDLTITGSPTHTEAVSNGRYALVNGGSGNSLEVPRAVIVSHPCELVASFAPVNDGGSRYVISANDASSSDLYGIYTQGTDNRSGFRADETGAGGDSLEDPGAAVADGVWRTAAAQASASTAQALSVDGTQVDTGTSAVDPVGVSRLTLFAQQGDGSLDLVGKAQRFVVASTLSAAQRARVTNWIARAYQGAA